MPHAPRTVPSERYSRTGLLLRVSGGKPVLRPRVKDPWFGEPVVDKLRCPPPLETILLASSPERFHPKALNVVEECTKHPSVGRDRMVGKVASDDLSQPSPLFRDRLVSTSSQFPLDLFELGPQAIAPGLPSDDEIPKATATAYQGEAQKMWCTTFLRICYVQNCVADHH